MGAEIRVMSYQEELPYNRYGPSAALQRSVPLLYWLKKHLTKSGRTGYRTWCENSAS